MATSGTISGNQGAAGLNSVLSSGSKSTTAKKNEEIGKDQFLQLLITQLKNQDPEQPMDSKEFAVQLAQFTQVEKLISIDQKLGKQTDAGSLAGFLGQQVELDGSDIAVTGGKGGQLSLNLLQDAADVKVQLSDKDGNVVGEKSVGPLMKGEHTVSLEGLGVPNGNYGVKVTALSTLGTGTFSPDVKVSGLVTGFIPGDNPKLIVNGTEVQVSQIKQVTLPPASSGASSTGAGAGSTT